MNVLLQLKAPRLKVHTHQNSFFGSVLRAGRRTVKYLTVFVHDPRLRTSFFFCPFPKFFFLNNEPAESSTWIQIQLLICRLSRSSQPPGFRVLLLLAFLSRYPCLSSFSVSLCFWSRHKVI